MADFYSEMADMATEMLGEFAQGVCTLKRVTTTEGPNPWDPPSEVVQTFDMKASVKRVNQRFDRGTVIVETGDLVTFATLEIEPALTDLLAIDGADRAITDLKRIPAAGMVVAWQAFCKA